MGAQRVRHNLSTKQQQTLSQYFLNVTSISHLIGGRREEGDRRWDGISRHEFEQTPDRLKDREMVQIHGVSKSRAQLSNWTTTKYLETCLAHNRCLKSESEVAQSCPTLCDPRDCSLPGSSLYGILQARVLEWVAISFSRVSSRPRDWTRVSCIPGRRFNLWATREAQ